jgi:hypothetical protein
MKRHYRMLLAAASVTGFVIGGPLVGLGVSTAGAAPTRAQTVVITVNAVTGNETFTATGPISGSGVDTPQSSRPTGGVTHGVDLFSLTAGPQSGSTFTVKHVGRETDTFDPTTCVVTIKGRGNYVTTGGTGALSKVMGSGHYTLSGTISFLTGTVCNPNGNPSSGSEVITAMGRGKA